MIRVEVNWLDSVVGERWTTPKDVEGRRSGACTSVGYLVDENDEAITIAQTVGEGEDGVEEYGQIITIPRGALCGRPVSLMAGRIVHGDEEKPCS